MSELQFTVPAEQSGKRIDSWLAEQIEGLTRRICCQSRQ